ncbi:16S rRNA (cytosine(1402)-N(4))-methyltransferase RsmH [Campylobacter sp. CCUG 57310]|uniref:16S rRNA (cytosine(1402)-N(4))-methyltransferase RsmH n=1 Tax=Campylobacter sp. CCUG 57310 TaxID=2517362 RepID=UPI001566B50D|nr:16S rRNA (cytosine(1402)-N(4))-methyltransferase RsmH [Campylobacter sp. CCUG 57310]QKF92055.1 16S rRNA m4C1402 methyltransferase [Campylobacter sp. CCUG 57310]
MNSPHVPVLPSEVLQAFSDIKEGVVVDCTLGYAGHSSLILEQNDNVKLIACDQDDEAIEFSTNKLAKFKDRVSIFKSRFSEILSKVNTREIRGILADIGVSSLQLDKNERGFGLKSDNLDMRMDTSGELTAYEVVNFYPEHKLAQIFKDYGELTNAKQIAASIANARHKQKISSASELARIIGTKSLKNRSVSPAILAFQAIRIEVNSELTELENLLNAIENSSINECVVAIISFHSLEDRIVKNRFKKWAKSCICPDEAMRCTCGNNHSIGEIVTKKAIMPSVEEAKQNPRSSCAKMRIFKISRGKNAR